jgi:acetamidase/formamidase
MRYSAAALLLLFVSQAQSQQPLTGSWIATADFYGTTVYLRIELDQQAHRLAATISGRRLSGSIEGSTIHLVETTPRDSKLDLTATLQNGTLSGHSSDLDANDHSHDLIYTFTAIRIPARKPGPPQRHDFTPTVFYRQYSSTNKPVLTVNPGDTIHTTTVDASGIDAQGIRRSRGGNPETGPFYIETAMPGDTLAVHLIHLKLNRDYAGSNDSITESGLNSSLAIRMRDTGKSIRWHLDLAKGVASPESHSEHLAHFTIPLRPMLGCIATAPSPAQGAPGTTDSGSFGGNMDFNEITDGATVYLPVSNPGALLYIGDAHAAMGDGEINGNALETSMDVEFTVDVIAGKRVPGPRVETATHLISMGLEGSLDDAFRDATDDMARWLTEDYQLTPSEIGQVIGSAAEYKVSEIADRNSAIVLKMRKDLLQNLDHNTKK